MTTVERNTDSLVEEGTVDPAVTDVDREVAEAVMLTAPTNDEEYCEGCALHEPGLESDCEKRGETAECEAQYKRHREKCAERIAGVLAPKRERAARVKEALAAVLYDPKSWEIRTLFFEDSEFLQEEAITGNGFRGPTISSGLSFDICTLNTIKPIQNLL